MIAVTQTVLGGCDSLAKAATRTGDARLVELKDREEGTAVVAGVVVAAAEETLSGAVAARDKMLAFRLVGWALPVVEIKI